MKLAMKRLLDRRGRQESDVRYGQITEQLADGDCNVALLQTGEIIRCSRATSGEHYAVGEVVTLGDLSASGVATGGGMVIIGRPNGSMRNTTTPAAETQARTGMVITRIDPFPLILCRGDVGDITIYGFNLVEPTYSASLTEDAPADVTANVVTLHIQAPSDETGRFGLIFPTTIVQDCIEVRQCGVVDYEPHLFIGTDTLLTKMFESTAPLATFTERAITGAASVTLGRAWAGAGDDIYIASGLGTRRLLKLDRQTAVATELLADSGYTPHTTKTRNCFAWDAAGDRVAIIGTKFADSTIRAVVLTISTGAVLWESAALGTGGAGQSTYFDGTDFWFACVDNKIRRVDGATYAETVIATASRPRSLVSDGTSVFVGYDKLSGTDARLLGKISRATNVIDAAEVAAAASKRNALELAYEGGDLYLLCIDSTASNHARVIKVNPASMAILNETLTAHTAAAVTSVTSQLALSDDYLFVASTDGSGVVSRMDRTDLGNLTTGTIPPAYSGAASIGNALIWI